MDYYFEALQKRDRLESDSIKAMRCVRYKFYQYVDQLGGKNLSEDEMRAAMGQSTYDSYKMLLKAFQGIDFPEDLQEKVAAFYKEHLSKIKELRTNEEKEAFGDEVRQELPEIREYFDILEKKDQYENAITLLLQESIKAKRDTQVASLTDEQRQLIREIEQEAAELDDYENSSGEHAFELFNDGELFCTKGGDLYGERSTFSFEEALVLPPMTFPRERAGFTYAILKEEDARRIRDKMVALSKELSGASAQGPSDMGAES